MASSEQIEKAEAFKALHIKGNPIVLYNIWDAGSAKAISGAGAKALATGSAPLAAAQGYADGQNIPFDFLLTLVERIIATSDLPLSVDFEAGFATEPEGVFENASKLIDTGAVGVNFEDQKIGGEGFYATSEQVGRIAAVRRAGDSKGIPFFINARTDLFLKEPDQDKHADLFDEAIVRGRAYMDAGANGFFVPGLKGKDLIARVCEAIDAPVNVIRLPGTPEISELASVGVARISYGPVPYRTIMKQFATNFENLS
jgi:2-methylisocitrate lyase-like PEP mutase family enzyme